MSNIPRCATCKHWGLLANDETRARSRVEWCDVIKETMIVNIGMSGYGHMSACVDSISVPFDFGCVLHEEIV